MILFGAEDVDDAQMLGPWEVAGYRVEIDVTERVRLVATGRGGRLKALPPAVRGSEEMAWLRLSLDAVRTHHRQLRLLLENAMVEGIALSADDLAMLSLDAVGREMLGRLLVRFGGVTGRPLPDDWLCESLGGDLFRLAAPVHVVHPVSFPAETQARWNGWLNRTPFRQPFKQIRREVYRPNEQDRADGAFSSRFDGERVLWDRARALLEGRGWYRVTKTLAERRFRRARITAHVEFREPLGRGYTKMDVHLGRVYFLPTGEVPCNRGRPGMPVGEVPPVVFSETLRDVNLVARAAAR